MLDLPQDRIARREESETAHAIMRSEERRADNAKISKALAAFDLVEQADAAGIQRARHDFKTAQIALAAAAPGMPPGNDRRWVQAFLNVTSVWCDLSAPVDDRALAGDMAALLARQIRAARGLA